MAIFGSASLGSYLPNIIAFFFFAGILYSSTGMRSFDAIVVGGGEAAGYLAREWVSLAPKKSLLILGEENVRGNLAAAARRLPGSGWAPRLRARARALPDAGLAGPLAISRLPLLPSNAGAVV